MRAAMATVAAGASAPRVLGRATTPRRCAPSISGRVAEGEHSGVAAAHHLVFGIEGGDLPLVVAIAVEVSAQYRRRQFVAGLPSIGGKRRLQIPRSPEAEQIGGGPGHRLELMAERLDLSEEQQAANDVEIVTGLTVRF